MKLGKFSKKIKYLPHVPIFPPVSKIIITKQLTNTPLTDGLTPGRQLLTQRLIISSFDFYFLERKNNANYNLSLGATFNKCSTSYTRESRFIPGHRIGRCDGARVTEEPECQTAGSEHTAVNACAGSDGRTRGPEGTDCETEEGSCERERVSIISHGTR